MAKFQLTGRNSIPADTRFNLGDKVKLDSDGMFYHGWVGTIDEIKYTPSAGTSYYVNTNEYLLNVASTEVFQLDTSLLDWIDSAKG